MSIITIVLSLLSFLCLLQFSVGQAQCHLYTTCDKCTDMVCTWCAETKKCILVTEECSSTDPHCKTVEKQHTYLIGITIGVFIVMVAVMLGVVKIFYFPRRSRVLAKHARRPELTDLKAFADASIKQSLELIKEPFLWCDVSLSNIWFVFGICGAILVLGLPFAIMFIAGTYSVAGWVVSTIIPLVPCIAFVFYFTSDKGQYSRINVLTNRGAYVITTGIRTQTFVAYSQMINVTVTEARGGLGNVIFSGGGQSAIGFYNIPNPHTAVRIINEQLDLLPRFAQNAARVEISPFSENAPLLSSSSPNVL